MRTKQQKPFAKATALAMAAVLMTASVSPAGTADAKAKKPQLSKKSVTITVGKTKKVKLKNTSKVKKTKWSIKNKKIAKLTKKKKTSIVIRGKKEGKTTVTAKVTVKGKKKAVKLKLKVQVVKNVKTTGQPDDKKPTASPGSASTASAKPDASPSAGSISGAGSSDAPGTSSQPTPSGSAGTTGSPDPSGNPAVSGSPDTQGVSIAVPGNRTGIKQGETIALTATGADRVTWSVTGGTGVSISADGKLTVAKEAAAGTSLTITAQAAGDMEKKATKKLTVAEDNTPVLTDKEIQLNQADDIHPLGLTYRSPDAYETVTDPERGDVIRFDAGKGYTSSSYDVLAWMVVDPAYAGKKVTISAYMKYEASEDITGNMNLVINERWGDVNNPACKYNAEPDTWYHITGEYTLPKDSGSNYSGDDNKLYIARDTDPKHLAAGKNAVYYIDSLVFSVEKADIEKVTLTTDEDKTEIYQNHDLQCSASVTGTGAPSQKVIYSIDPPVEGATISDTGLLSVKKASAGAKINVKATSIEDPEKSDTKTITVLAQQIQSVSVTADETPKEIYPDTTLQFHAVVTSAGEPDESVRWSLVQPVQGVTLSEDGLLTVGEQAPAETKLQIKAASVFDETKSDTYEITIKANKINGVTIETIGKTIEPGASLYLTAKVDNGGTNAGKGVRWTLTPQTAGVSITPNGNGCTLAADSTVADGTELTIRATSDFDKTQYGEVTVTVKKVVTEVFDFNKLSVEYFENFDGEDTTPDSVQEDGVLSWKATEPSDPTTFDSGYFTNPIDIQARYGIDKTDEGLSAAKRRTAALKSFFGDKEDYLQFTITNKDSIEKTYTLSFLFRFFQITGDNEYIFDEMGSNPDFVEYQLPLKFTATRGTENKTISSIQVPYLCNRATLFGKEFYEIIGSISVPAGETVYLRLTLNGDLPTCLSPNHANEDEAFANTPHPCVYHIDNVAISSGNLPTVSMKAGETYSLNLSTLDKDTVKYYTNSYLAQYTHGESDTCTRFATTVATVDENGVVTANTAGETACIAEITHENGDVERKQCIIHVE